MFGLSAFRSLSISSVLPVQAVRGMATKAAASSAATAAPKKKSATSKSAATKSAKDTKAKKTTKKTDKETEKAKAKKAEKPEKPKKIKPIDMPKRPSTPWALFYVEHLNKVRDSGKAIVPTQESAVASSIWKNLSEADKKPYDDTYKANLIEYKKALDQRLQEITPSEYKLENSRRQALRAAGKKVPALKDPNAPKRPLGSFFLYIQDQRKSGRFNSLSLTEQTRAIGEAWRNASENDKKVYVEKSRAALKAYHAAKEEYEKEKE